MSDATTGYQQMTKGIEAICSNYIITSSECQGAILDVYLNYDKLPYLNFMVELDIQGFTLHLYQQGVKDRTVEYYTRSLKRLSRHLPELTTDAVNAFFLQQLKDHRATSYINDYVMALKKYTKWKGITDIKLHFLKEHPTIKDTLSDKEIEAFLQLPPPIVKHMFHGKLHEYEFMPEKYHLWTLFFKVMAYSGMRCGEVATLTVDQIDFGRNVFLLTDTKTNTPRYVPIAPFIISALQQHITTLSRKYVFGGKTDRPPLDVEWGRRFHERLSRLGIKRSHLTPYSFRHSFITRMLEEDVNIFKVQKIVGHKKIETTAHYTHLTTKDLQRTILKDRLARSELSVKQKFVEILSLVQQFIQGDDTMRLSISEKETSLAITLESA